MLLGLSSAAAPASGIGELLESCTLRGLSTLELCAGDGHGIDANGEWSIAIAGALAAAADAGVRIAGFMTASSPDAGRFAQLSEALDAPIIVADECGIEDRIERAHGIIGDGGRALVLARGSASGWQSQIADSTLDYAWEVDASRTDLAEDAAAVLGQPLCGLQYIRFIGGGPEAAMHEGRGIGTLMGRLALAGYGGPLILAPGTPRYRVIWESWLGRRGGWGCGSRVADAGLVNLPAHVMSGGE